MLWQTVSELTWFMLTQFLPSCPAATWRKRSNVNTKYGPTQVDFALLQGVQAKGWHHSNSGICLSLILIITLHPLHLHSPLGEAVAHLCITEVLRPWVWRHIYKDNQQLGFNVFSHMENLPREPRLHSESGKGVSSKRDSARESSEIHHRSVELLIHHTSIMC